MHLLTALLIAVAANLDNGGVGIAYGLRGITIGILPNLLIAAIGAAGTALFAVLGANLARSVPSWLGHWIGAGVIIAVGLWVLAGAEAHRPAPAGDDDRSIFRNPALADRDRSGDLSFGEAAVLGVALGVNAWAGGLGAGLLGIPLVPVVILVGVMSVTLLAAGATVGSQVAARWFGPRATMAAGVLLILIGLHQLI